MGRLWHLKSLGGLLQYLQVIGFEVGKDQWISNTQVLKGLPVCDKCQSVYLIYRLSDLFHISPETLPVPTSKKNRTPMPPHRINQCMAGVSAFSNYSDPSLTLQPHPPSPLPAPPVKNQNKGHFPEAHAFHSEVSTLLPPIEIQSS